MRVLLFHARQYKMKVTGLATRPNDVKPEPVSQTEQSCDDCVAVFICVEKGDLRRGVINDLSQEIEKMTEDIGRRKIVLAPFAHLSSNLASSDEAMHVLDVLQDKLSGYEVIRTHFGSDKELLLDVFGHPGNVRFREF